MISKDWTISFHENHGFFSYYLNYLNMNNINQITWVKWQMSHFMERKMYLKETPPKNLLKNIVLFDLNMKTI